MIKRCVSFERSFECDLLGMTNTYNYNTSCCYNFLYLYAADYTTSIYDCCSVFMCLSTNCSCTLSIRRAYIDVNKIGDKRERNMSISPCMLKQWKMLIRINYLYYLSVPIVNIHSIEGVNLSFFSIRFNRVPKTKISWWIWNVYNSKYIVM